MTFVVGIDSGGTHSNIRILTPDGEQKTVPEFDKSLSSNRSDAELTDLLAENYGWHPEPLSGSADGLMDQLRRLLSRIA